MPPLRIRANLQRYAYHCNFCGYPQTRQNFPETLRSMERNVRARVERVLEGLKPRAQPQITYYPVNLVLQPCVSCGFSFPRGTNTCPSCGTPRTTLTDDLDRRVFDYIAAHGGTISLSQAAQELTISQPVLLSAIERLKTGGYLNQS